MIRQYCRKWKILKQHNIRFTHSYSFLNDNNINIKKKKKTPIHQLIISGKYTLEDVYKELSSRQPFDPIGFDSFTYRYREYQKSIGLDKININILNGLVTRFRDQLLKEPKKDKIVPPMESPNEATLSNLIDILIFTEKKENIILAESLMKLMQNKMDHAPLRLRTYQPFLDYYVKNNLVNEAEILWKKMQTDKVVLNEDVILKYIKLYITKKPKNIIKIFSFMQNSIDYKQISLNGSQKFLQFFKKQNDFQIHETKIINNSICSICNTKLIKEEINIQERETILSLIKKMYPSQMIEAYNKWLIKNKKYNLLQNNEKIIKKNHYIIDGPNVGYTNQNHPLGYFRFDQIDALANYLSKYEHDVTIILPKSYMNKKKVYKNDLNNNNILNQHLNHGKMKVTENDLLLFQKWKDNKWLYTCPFVSTGQDDFFWLYGTFLLGKSCYVVTNDLIRDHLNKLLLFDEKNNNKIKDIIRRWRDIVPVRYDFIYKQNERDLHYNKNNIKYNNINNNNKYFSNNNAYIDETIIKFPSSHSNIIQMSSPNDPKTIELNYTSSTYKVHIPIHFEENSSTNKKVYKCKKSLNGLEYNSVSPTDRWLCIVKK